MKRIGLLSDTHAYWDDRYLQYFERCDEIWHAGDIGSLELAMKLNEFRPLKAVFGNCDGGDLRRLYTERLRWTCEGADVLMTHIGGYPGTVSIVLPVPVWMDAASFFFAPQAYYNML